MSIVFVNVDDAYIRDLAVELLSNDTPITHLITTDIEGLSKIQDSHSVNVIDSNLLYQADSVASLKNTQEDMPFVGWFEEMASCESMFLSITDSYSFFPLSVRKRKKLFRNLCLYWNALLRSNSVSHIFFPYSPSQGWDTVLYSVAKTLNIKTTVLVRTSIQDRVLLLNNFRMMSKVPLDYLHAEASDSIQRSLGADLCTALKEESSWVEYSNKRNCNVLGKDSSQHSLKNRCISFFKSVVKGLCETVKRVTTISTKKEFKSKAALSMNSKSVNWSLYLVYFFSLFRIRKLKSYYDEHSQPLNTERAYVYFALHNDPGMTTQPEGGVFEDQYLAISMLSQSLPEGWILYVKEHPRQFETSYESIKQTHYRSSNDYDELLKLENVHLLSMDCSRNSVISQASLVATITGSVGWQALNLGKPCITFGYPWYSACNSCYIVESVDDCRVLFNVISELSQAEVKRDVLRFVSYINDQLVIGSSRKIFAEMSPRLYGELVSNLAIAMNAIFSNTQIRLEESDGSQK